MGLLHRSIIRWYLNLEHLCLECFVGGLRQEQTPGTRCLRRFFGFLVFLAVFALEMVYYYIHFYYNQDIPDSNEETDENPYDIQTLVDVTVILVFLSFPIMGPLHRSLGYGNDNVDPLILQSRIDDLIQDQGTRRSINLTIVCTGLYTVGESIFGLSVYNTISPVAAFVYVVFILVNIATIYFAMLIIMLTMRTTLTRLTRIEESVDDALDHVVSAQMGNSDDDNGTSTYNSMSTAATVMVAPNENTESAIINTTQYYNWDQLSQEWTNDYRKIRQDVHHVSHYFGGIMLIGLFLFVLDTTTMVAVLWENLGPTMSQKSEFALLLSFSSNAVMIMAAMYSTAFMVTKCNHYIGPKIAMLAASTRPQLSSVSTLFLHAPIRLHVGNFELSPEYANAISLWFVGLFLLVFGLKIPGSE